MKQEEIEIQLWEYIDGACSEAEAARISVLIKEDLVWKLKHAELSALNANITADLELEQPSMRFTKNIMEAVAATQIAPATKKYINPIIIKGIAAFFIITIASVLGYTIATANWSAGGNVITNQNFSITGLFNSTTLSAFIMICIVLGLVLVDAILRKKIIRQS